MTVDQWLRDAVADADRRGIAGLRPLLETLARATTALRDADWNIRADGRPAGRRAAGHHGNDTSPDAR